MSDRVETGPVRFGDDWAGVFLRGDYAVPMSGYLHDVLDFAASKEGKGLLSIRFAPLRSLANTLAECDERRPMPGLQQLPSFAMCKALERRIEALETLAAEKEADVARLRATHQHAAAIEKDGAARALRSAVQILRGEA